MVNLGRVGGVGHDEGASGVVEGLGRVGLFHRVVAGRKVYDAVVTVEWTKEGDAKCADIPCIREMPDCRGDFLLAASESSICDALFSVLKGVSRRHMVEVFLEPLRHTCDLVPAPHVTGGIEVAHGRRVEGSR